jgi:hypothetical protein
MVAGICKSPTLDQVKDLLTHAASLADKAKSATAFAKYAQVLGPAGEKLDRAADDIGKLIKKGKSISGDVSAACEISEAVAVLNDWSLPNSKTSSQDAAKAFDRLFGGAANFFEKLPPPVNAYAQIFAEVSKNNFFSNMRDQLDPESPNTPRGRAMREVLDSMNGN